MDSPRSEQRSSETLGSDRHRQVSYTDGMNTQYSSRNLLTRQEAADRLKVSLTTMSSLIKAGDIFVLRFKRQVRIPEEALDDYVNGIKPTGYGDPMHEPDGGTYPPTESLIVGLNE